MEHKFNSGFFEKILSNQTEKPIKINDVKIEVYYDDPGLHWSNPGVKKIIISTSSKTIELIVKILHERSKREILIYRFLSQHPHFPIPKLYYTEYNEDTNNYFLIIEFEESIGEWPFKEPEIVLCGKLAAQIHSYFYDKTNILPEFFIQESYYNSRFKFKDNSISYLERLSKGEMKVIENIYPDIHSLKNAIESLDIDFFIIEPYTHWVLIHGGFHPPEIVAKKGEKEKVPLGVDWEGSRLGHPAEDIVGITGQLADWGKPHYYDLLLNSYLEESRNHNIYIDKDDLEREILVENIISQIKILPFLWSQYLKNKNNVNFSNWIDWFERSIPKTTNSILNDLSKIN
jgi:hypothetical protein